MIDPTAARDDRLRETGRWGYTGEMEEDPVPVEESRGINGWLLGLALIALIVIAFIAFAGMPL